MTGGRCDPSFEGVRDVFAASLAAGSDLGGAVAVFVDGRCVVDVWGGVADARTGRQWSADTACVTFSCTKAVTATAALVLAERGTVDLDAPVVEWWPEYGRHGKERTTGVHLLTHQAGVPAFARPIAAEEAADPIAMADQLAGQEPEWTPGTAHGYHALTFGWLVGELVRRHVGQPLREFVRAELGTDLWLGVPDAMVDGLARLSAGRPGRTVDLPLSHETATRVAAAVANPDSLLLRSTGNPAASFNKPVVLTAGWPAAGLITTARALAGFYQRLLDGQILAPDTLRDAVRARVRGPDRTMVVESAFGLGYMLPAGPVYWPAAAQAGAFGHPGASGALAFADLERGVAFAYIPNLTRPLYADRRAYTLVEAVYAAL